TLQSRGKGACGDDWCCFVLSALSFVLISQTKVPRTKHKVQSTKYKAQSTKVQGKTRSHARMPLATACIDSFHEHFLPRCYYSFYFALVMDRQLCTQRRPRRGQFTL